jgi:hypothetical protein
MNYSEEVEHDDEDRIKELLVGRRIVATEKDTLILDDGRRLIVEGNYGCGGCTSGNYWVDGVAGFDNVITSVDFRTDSRKGDDDWSRETVYRIFVYSNALAGEVVTVAGDDGNGYYGTGYRIYVKDAS